jgi:hypothetical protein
MLSSSSRLESFIYYRDWVHTDREINKFFDGDSAINVTEMVNTELKEAKIEQVEEVEEAVEGEKCA